MFRGSDIKDLHVSQVQQQPAVNKPPQDPAIMSAQPRIATHAATVQAPKPAANAVPAGIVDVPKPAGTAQVERRELFACIRNGIKKVNP